VPWKLKLPAGKYAIREMQGKTVLSQADVEVKALGTLSVQVHP
jgi:hypothetical protein